MGLVNDGFARRHASRTVPEQSPISGDTPQGRRSASAFRPSPKVERSAVIVCHCNVIRRAQIVRTIRDLLAEDASAPLEPQYVYKALLRRGRCCGCFPTVRNIVAEVLESAMSDVDGASVLNDAGRTHLMPEDEA